MRSLYKAEAMEFSVHVCHSSQSLLPVFSQLPHDYGTLPSYAGVRLTMLHACAVSAAMEDTLATCTICLTL